MRYLGAIVAVTLGSAVQLAACAPRVTSLDSDKTLTALSAAERQQYCEDQFHYLTSRVPKDDRHKIECSAAAAAVLSGTADRERGTALCEQTYRTCLGLPAAEPQSSCETFAADNAGCAATVGEATKCAEARADALATLASKADDTCKDVEGGRAVEKEEPGKTEACTRVQSLCPKLFSEPASSGKR